MLKRFLVIMFLFCQSSLFAQNHTSLLKIVVNDCRSGEPDWGQQLKLYKLPENILYHTLQSFKYKEGKIEIPYFIPGTYRLEYKNVFGENIEKLYQLDDCDSNKITICVEEFEQQPGNSLERLSENDSIAIGFSSFGCFHNSQERIVITKKDKYYEAKIYPAIVRPSRFKEEQKSCQPTTIILTEKNIRDFEGFENGLTHVKKDGGCTTVDYYDISTKWGTQKVEDATCRWSGFWYLKKSLVGGK